MSEFGPHQQTMEKASLMHEAVIAPTINTAKA
jgi:hypothetical protein